MLQSARIAAASSCEKKLGQQQVARTQLAAEARCKGFLSKEVLRSRLRACLE